MATTAPLQSVSGHDLKVKGKTQIKIDHVGPIAVHVVEEMAHDLLIGTDMLKKGCCVINYPRKTLTWFKKEWPFKVEQNGSIDAVGETYFKTGYKRIDDILYDYAYLFAEKGSEIGYCDMRPMIIETTGPPIYQRPYRVPLTKRKVIDKQIDEMLEDGIIRPSDSPWSSPVTLVPKKDGTTRFCTDYRKVNSITRKDRYPLARIQDIFDSVGGSVIFSTLDLKSGYWQIPVAEQDIEKTAFSCHRGHFEYLRMPFGLANAPAVFQRTMDKVLAPVIGQCAMVYIDDIVVYSKSVREHADHLSAVFELLSQAGLRVKPSKCTFALPEIELLGYVVNGEGIKSNPNKVEVIVNLPPPKSIKEVRSFLGMCSYYRQTMPNFAVVSSALTELTKKNVRFRWTNIEQEAFDTLKQLLVSSHVMAHPQQGKPYKLYTDACDYAVGAILVQSDENGIERVIQYVSHQLSGPQLRWATIEKEAYAVVYSIHKLRPYLYGAQFTVYTDHKPLTSLFTKEMINTKIQRWAVFLSEYGAKIEYRKGTNNIRADMLSRIRPEIATLGNYEYKMEGFTDPLIQVDGFDSNKIQQQQCLEFTDLIAEAKDEQSSYVLIDGLLYSEKRPEATAAIYPRLILPSCYQHTVIERAHKEVGHMSALKTLDRVREAYIWPGMRKSIGEYLKTCAVCLAHTRHKVHVPMGDMPIVLTPMSTIAMDLIGPFVPSVNNNKYMLTLICLCSGWAEVVPIRDKTNESVWRAFSNHFLPQHGHPETIITDNGKEFTANAFERYLADAGIHHARTTPVHPEGNSKIERFNRTFKELLAKALFNKTADWEDKIADVLSAYRHSVSSVTGYTPFFLLYGRRGRVPLEQFLTVDQSENKFGNRLDDLAEAYRLAAVNTLQSRKYNKERLQKQSNASLLTVGDTVIVKAEERLTNTTRWDPEYEIYRIRGTTHWVRHQPTGKTRVLHREKLIRVDPNIDWEGLVNRPKRVRARPLPPRLRAEPVPVPEEAPAPGDDESEEDNADAPSDAVPLTKARQCLARAKVLARAAAGVKPSRYWRRKKKKRKTPTSMDVDYAPTTSSNITPPSHSMLTRSRDDALPGPSMVTRSRTAAAEPGPPSPGSCIPDDDQEMTDSRDRPPVRPEPISLRKSKRKATAVEDYTAYLQSSKKPAS